MNQGKNLVGTLLVFNFGILGEKNGKTYKTHEETS
jgi:hypothetical protein